MPGQVAALECTLEKWLKPSLPRLNLRIRSKPMFKEDEMPIRFQHSVDSSQRLDHTGNRTHREGAHNRIDT